MEGRTRRSRGADDDAGALAVIRAKGWDEGDKVLRQCVAHRLVNALTQAAKRGSIAADGKRGGVRVWRGPSDLWLASIGVAPLQIAIDRFGACR